MKNLSTLQKANLERRSSSVSGHAKTKASITDSLIKSDITPDYVAGASIRSFNLSTLVSTPYKGKRLSITPGLSDLKQVSPKAASL